MKKDIYSLLNEVQTDTSGYPPVRLTEEEMQKYRKNLRKRTGSRRRKTAVAAVAAAACLALVASLVPFLKSTRNRTEASGNQAGKYSIESILGTREDIEDYVLEIGKTKELEKASVTLNSAVMDDSSLVVYSTFYYREAGTVPRYSQSSWGRAFDSTFPDTTGGIQKMYRVPEETGSGRWEYSYTQENLYVQRLFLNGEELAGDVTAEGVANEKGILQDTAYYRVDTSRLEYPLEVTVQYYDVENLETPEAEFSFELTETNQVPGIVEVPLEQTVTLPDGQQFTLTRFTCNALGSFLYGEYQEPREETERYALRLEDQSSTWRNIGLFQIFLDETRFVFTDSPFDRSGMSMAVLQAGSLEFTIKYVAPGEGSWKTLEEKITVDLPKSP